MDIFDLFEDVKEEEKLCFQEYNQVLKKQEFEMSLAMASIKDRFHNQLADCSRSVDLAVSKFQNIRCLLELYSTFDCDVIGRVIARLISSIENEEYLYCEVKHSSYQFLSGLSDDFFERILKVARVIIKKSEYNKNYIYYDSIYEDRIKDLSMRGNLFLLLESPQCISLKLKIGFYYVTSDKKIASPVDFSRFSYVKDFIDMVINYRFDNKINDISEEELYRLMNCFLSSYIGDRAYTYQN